MHIYKQFKKGFLNACLGIQYACRHERNFRIELGLALIAIILGFIVKITLIEWVILLLVISSVLVLELINTGFEILVDFIKPRLHDQVEIIKNIVAGAVLVASFVAVIQGGIIFVPYFFKFCFRFF